MKVLLADDNPDVRTALRLVIENHPGYEVCGEAADASLLLSLCASTCPDAIILDPEITGVLGRKRSTSLGELLSALRSLCPSVCLVALSSFRGSAREAWLGQVDASFWKSDPPDDLLDFLTRRDPC